MLASRIHSKLYRRVAVCWELDPPPYPGLDEDADDRGGLLASATAALEAGRMSQERGTNCSLRSKHVQCFPQTCCGGVSPKSFWGLFKASQKASDPYRDSLFLRHVARYKIRPTTEYGSNDDHSILLLGWAPLGIQQHGVLLSALATPAFSRAHGGGGGGGMGLRFYERWPHVAVGVLSYRGVFSGRDKRWSLV